MGGHALEELFVVSRRYEGEGALDAVFEAVWNFCVFLSLCDAMERESAESE